MRATLPLFPKLWLNELLPQNYAGITNGIADRFGDSDLCELYNGGTNAISLSGYYLGTNYTNLLQWAFPADAVINPGQFVVWLDGEPGESISSELHASFRIPSGSGSLVLTRVTNSQPTVPMYLN